MNYPDCSLNLKFEQSINQKINRSITGLKIIHTSKIYISAWRFRWISHENMYDVRVVKKENNLLVGPPQRENCEWLKLLMRAAKIKSPTKKIWKFRWVKWTVPFLCAPNIDIFYAVRVYRICIKYLFVVG